MQKLLYSYSYIDSQRHYSCIRDCYPEIDCNNVEVIYFGFVGQFPQNINDEEVINIRNQILAKGNKDTRYFFDCMMEGVVLSIIPIIHKIIDGHISEKNTYYFTSAINGQELYNHYVEIENIEKRINIVCHENQWEQSLSHPPHNIEYSIKEKDKLFLCFNRVNRHHRIALLGLIIENNLLDRSYYSFLGTTHSDSSLPVVDTNILSHLISEDTLWVVKKNIESIRDKLPLALNIVGTNENATYIKSDDAEYFSNSYLSLVTETMFFPHDYETGSYSEYPIFFSEKIFKPILMKHPFIIVSRAGSLRYLKKLGYKTFNGIIDESYDDIENHEERLTAIVTELSRLSLNSTDEWIKWQTHAEEIVNHNYHNFINRKKRAYR